MPTQMPPLCHHLNMTLIPKWPPTQNGWQPNVAATPSGADTESRWTDKWTDKWPDKWTDKCPDNGTDKWTDKWTTKLLVASLSFFMIYGGGAGDPLKFDLL